MNINEALNKLCMRLLLNKEIIWESNKHSKSLYNEESIMLNGNMFTLSLYIYKTNMDSEEDTYYFDTIFKYIDGRIIITNEMKVSLNHNEKLINEILNNKELLEFIELNANNESNIWFANHNYDNWLINYTEKIYMHIDIYVNVFKI